MNNFLKLVVIHYILTINIMCNNEYPETDKKKFSGNDQTSDNKIEEINDRENKTINLKYGKRRINTTQK